MKKDKWLIGGIVIVFLILLTLIGSAVVIKSNEMAKERKEQQVLKMEERTAQRIKNTFVGVTEIKFHEKYIENKMTGYTVADITIRTDYGLKALLEVNMSPNDNPSEKLSDWEDIPEIAEGVTKKEVKVIFSDKKEKNM